MKKYVFNGFHAVMLLGSVLAHYQGNWPLAIWMLVALIAVTLDKIHDILKSAHDSKERPAQPTPTKCWKCGDADPAFTDVCQVPACGMREAP